MKVKGKENKIFEIEKDGISIELTLTEIKKLSSFANGCSSGRSAAVEKEVKRRGITVSEDDFINLVFRYDELVSNNIKLPGITLESCLEEAFEFCGF